MGQGALAGDICLCGLDAERQSGGHRLYAGSERAAEPVFRSGGERGAGHRGAGAGGGEPVFHELPDGGEPANHEIVGAGRLGVYAPSGAVELAEFVLPDAVGLAADTLRDGVHPATVAGAGAGAYGEFRAHHDTGGYELHVERPDDNRHPRDGRPEALSADRRKHAAHSSTHCLRAAEVCAHIGRGSVHYVFLH